MIETCTFRLNPGVALEDFLSADKALQAEFSAHRHGMLRRTTARACAVEPDGSTGLLAAGDDQWMVSVLWDSPLDADTSADRDLDDPVAQAFWNLVEQRSVVVRRYMTID